MEGSVEAAKRLARTAQAVGGSPGANKGSGAPEAAVTVIVLVVVVVIPDATVEVVFICTPGAGGHPCLSRCAKEEHDEVLGLCK